MGCHSPVGIQARPAGQNQEPPAVRTTADSTRCEASERYQVGTEAKTRLTDRWSERHNGRALVLRNQVLAYLVLGSPIRSWVKSCPALIRHLFSAVQLLFYFHVWHILSREHFVLSRSEIVGHKILDAEYRDIVG